MATGHSVTKPGTTTTNLFTVIKFYPDQEDGIYSNFLKNAFNNNEEQLSFLEKFEFDYYLKMNMRYHAENIITELNTFYQNSYNFF